MNTKSHKKSDTTNSPAELRAKRLKRLRNLANLTREQICDGSAINQHTLVGWENGRFGGLTTNGAKKIIEKVKKENVHCTLEWLMEGTGPEPSVNPISITSNESLDLSEDIIINYELAFFKAKNANAIGLVVNDDGMSPQYRPSDVVAGKKRTGKEIETLIGHDCIVELESGELLLRNLREGKFRNTFTLVCNNPNAQNKESVISDIKLIFAAPVIWHRKKDL